MHSKKVGPLIQNLVHQDLVDANEVQIHQLLLEDERIMQHGYVVRLE
jgi:hypothetical protein